MGCQGCRIGVKCEQNDQRRGVEHVSPHQPPPAPAREPPVGQEDEQDYRQSAWEEEKPGPARGPCQPGRPARGGRPAQFDRNRGLGRDAVHCDRAADTQDDPADPVLRLARGDHGTQPGQGHRHQEVGSVEEAGGTERSPVGVRQHQAGRREPDDGHAQTPGEPGHPGSAHPPAAEPRSRGGLMPTSSTACVARRKGAGRVADGWLSSRTSPSLAYFGI